MKKEIVHDIAGDSISLIKFEENALDEFMVLVESELFNRFGYNLPENYGREKDWSLLNLLNNNLIDSYVLLYVNEVFWGALGGIIRQFNGEKVYQTGFRSFTCTRKANHGLGSKSYIHEYIIKYHIKRAKQLNCTKIILSFNDHNRKLYELTRDYHLKKVFGKCNSWQSSGCLAEFNGVNQWLLTMCL